MPWAWAWFLKVVQKRYKVDGSKVKKPTRKAWLYWARFFLFVIAIFWGRLILILKVNRKNKSYRRLDKNHLKLLIYLTAPPYLRARLKILAFYLTYQKISYKLNRSQIPSQSLLKITNHRFRPSKVLTRLPHDDQQTPVLTKTRSHTPCFSDFSPFWLTRSNIHFLSKYHQN